MRPMLFVAAATLVLGACSKPGTPPKPVSDVPPGERTSQRSLPAYESLPPTAAPEAPSTHPRTPVQAAATEAASAVDVATLAQAAAAARSSE